MRKCQADWCVRELLRRGMEGTISGEAQDRYKVSSKVDDLVHVFTTWAACKRFLEK
jgi:hypothetical protein